MVIIFIIITRWFDTGLELVIGFIGLYKIVTAKNYSAIAKAHNLYYTATNIKPSHPSVSMVRLQNCTFSASVFTSFRLSPSSSWPQLLAIDCLAVSGHHWCSQGSVWPPLVLTSGLVGRAVCRSVNFLLNFASTAFPAFSPLKVQDQDYCSLLDIYVFRNGASSTTKEVVGVSA
jgi:hypothetical protein